MDCLHTLRSKWTVIWCEGAMSSAKAAVTSGRYIGAVFHRIGVPHRRLVTRGGLESRENVNSRLIEPPRTQAHQQVETQPSRTDFIAEARNGTPRACAARKGCRRWKTAARRKTANATGSRSRKCGDTWASEEPKHTSSCTKAKSGPIESARRYW